MDSTFFLGIVVAVAIYTLLGIIFLIVYRKLRFHQENKTIPSPLSPTVISSPSPLSPTVTSSPSPLSPTSFSPPSSSCNRKHQVFPSFHGEDVRKSILSHIKKEFKSKAIDHFIDNDIKKSKSIDPELIEAIKGSQIAIVFLSRNYASSSWCRNELVEIIKCREESSKNVMAIFYNVDPTDVKKQTGDFGKAFKKTCKGKTKEETDKWRHALAEVAKIAGYPSSKWDNEAEMIEAITNDISNMLNISTPSSDFTGLVGMEAHMGKMELRLCLENTDEVKMIGISGPSGIGKTTIARFLFSKHSPSFELSVFMENVKGTKPGCSDEHGLKRHLQQQLLSQIFNQKDIEVPHLGVAQERLKDKKVLVVLDDVDQVIQLDAMAKETQWFGPESRIIITTQDERLFKAQGITNVYKVGFPSHDEAFQIFCMNAFGQNSPKDGFEVLAWEAFHFAGIYPSGIRGVGSCFRGMSKHEWTDALLRLRTNRGSSVLKISRVRNKLSYAKRKALSRILSKIRKKQLATAAANAVRFYETSVKDFDEKKNVESSAVSLTIEFLKNGVNKH